MNKILLTILLLSPLSLFLLYGRAGVSLVDNTMIFVFFIYLTILGIYVVNNEGKMRSPQVIWDGGHFSTGMNEPVCYGDYACLWDGMRIPFEWHFKKRFIGFHKDSFSMMGQNCGLKVVPVKYDYEQLPPDLKQIFDREGFDRKNTEILFGLATREYMYFNPTITTMQRLIANISDEAHSNSQYARAKVGDFDWFIRFLANVKQYGADKGFMGNIADKIESSLKEKSDINQ